MKTVFLLTTLLMSVSSFGQTMTCRPHGDSLYKKLEIFKPDLNFDVSWFQVRLENKSNQRKIFTVDAVLRNEGLLFISKEGRNDFLFKIPDFIGPGTYHTAELVLSQGSHSEEKAELMCEVPADVQFANVCEGVDQKQALFQAAKSRHFLDLESALECGANGNAKNEFGCTALLLTADPFCGQTLPSPLPYHPLVKALPIVDILTNNGAVIDAKDPVNEERALHKFTKLGDFDVVSMLLDLEAEVDAQDNQGYTPLMRAVEKNDKFLVERFIEAAPELGLKNKKGETALMIAQKLGLKELQLLLQEPSTVIEITGKSDGSCTPSQVHIAPNQLTKFVLKASAEQMFLLTSSGLGLNLMANAGESVSQNIMSKQHGSFDFTCGVHGASKQTDGEITVH